MHECPSFEEAMQDYESFNIFISMLWHLAESIPAERFHEMILMAASTSDPDLAQTFIDNLEDISGVVGNEDVLNQAVAAAKKTIEIGG